MSAVRWRSELIHQDQYRRHQYRYPGKVRAYEAHWIDAGFIGEAYWVQYATDNKRRAHRMDPNCPGTPGFGKSNQNYCKWYVLDKVALATYDQGEIRVATVAISDLAFCPNNCDYSNT